MIATFVDIDFISRCIANYHIILPCHSHDDPFVETCYLWLVMSICFTCYMILFYSFIMKMRPGNTHQSKYTCIGIIFIWPQKLLITVQSILFVYNVFFRIFYWFLTKGKKKRSGLIKIVTHACVDEWINHSFIFSSLHLISISCFLSTSHLHLCVILITEDNSDCNMNNNNKIYDFLNEIWEDFLIYINLYPYF